MASVKLYTTDYCPFCHRAKNFFEEKSIPFEEVNLSDNPELRAEVQEKTGWMTVPMIFIGDEFIGGSDELMALDASGDLQKKLDQAG